MHNTLRLLVIEDSTDTVEHLAKTLRNAGYPVRERHIADLEELQSVLEEQDQEWDLVLCAAEGEYGDFKAANELLRATNPSLPVVVVTDACDTPTRVGLMRMGSRDVVQKSDTEHFLLVVAREYANGRTARDLARCANRYAESERRCQALLDSSRDAIAYIHEGMHIHCNPSYMRLFGYSGPEELQEMPVMDLIAPKQHEGFKKLLRRLNNGEPGAERFEFTGIKADSDSFDAVMHFSSATMDGEPCVQLIIQDLSLSKELEDKLHMLRQQDLVTGLLNRQYFLEQLETTVGATPEGCTLYYIGLDNMVGARAAVGMAGTDLLLRDVASLLRQHIPESALLARFSEDVFAALMPGTHNVDAIRTLARDVRAAVGSAIFDIEGKSLTATCSIGIAQVASANPNIHQCLMDAENAAGIARSEEGDGIHLHDLFSGNEREQELKAHWGRQIRDAINTDRFVLHYQPIVSLHAEPGERYEVLLRLEDDNHQLVLPGKFLPVAEEEGLMAEIDRWVIKKAISTLAVRRRSGIKTVFFIKLSAASLKTPALLPWISSYLKAARLPGDSLAFEVGERLLIDNLREAKAFTEGLHELHCKFVVDHAGGGGHGYSYLKHLKVGFLKIDGSFIFNLSGHPENQAAVREVTAIAQKNGQLTMAEFVHDASSLAILWQCGVNFVQGYYLQRPDESMNYDFSGD